MGAQGVMFAMDDRGFMEEAFAEARAAYERGECPVGAVVVREGEIIARAGNRERELSDATAHAEILAMRAAGQALGRHKLRDCVVYTTLWPCPMCQNAMLQAEIPQVVCGARSFAWITENRFDPGRLERVGPIMNEECRGIFIAWLREQGRFEILEREGL